MDETYVGGKPRKGGPRRRDIRKPDKPRTGFKKDDDRKIPVVGMVERDGKVTAHVVKKNKLNGVKISSLIRRHINTKETILVTDEWRGYSKVKLFMAHETINHSELYVCGDIHTNNIESFWALLKRGIVGQFHKVSVRYLHRYISEFCYRHNNRKNENVFELTIARGLGVSV
jgi:hypothetical protein